MRRNFTSAVCAIALVAGCADPVLCRDREGFQAEYDAVRGSRPADLHAWGGALFFTALDEQSPEAWRLHRYVPGSEPVPIQAPPSSPYYQWLMAPLTPFGDSLYAFKCTSLLRIGADGSLAPVAPLFFRDCDSGYGKGPYPTVYGGALYFQAMAPSGQAELLRYDGTGIELAADIDDWIGSYPSHLTVLGDTLYFFAGDLVNGRALWAFDGTSVSLAHDFAPDSKYYFGDADRIIGTRGTSLLLLVNGYPLGLDFELVSYEPGGAPVTLDTGVTSALLVGSTLVYTKEEGVFREDGAGPVSVGPSPWWDPLLHSGAELGGAIFLTAGAGGGSTERGLFEVGPGTLLPLLTGTVLTDIQDFVAFDGALYLSASDDPHLGTIDEGIVGHELWRFDPFTGDLTLVADLWPGWQHVCVVD